MTKTPDEPLSRGSGPDSKLAVGAMVKRVMGRLRGGPAPAIRIDLFTGDRGEYGVEVEALPAGIEGDYPFESANICIGGRGARSKADRSLTFTESVPGPFGIDVLRNPSCVLYLYIYCPRSAEQVFELQRRTGQRFATFFDGYGEHIAGSFSSRELGPDWVCEWASVDHPNRQAYRRAIASVEMDRDVEDIVDEARLLQNEASARYVLWLTPKGGI